MRPTTSAWARIAIAITTPAANEGSADTTHATVMAKTKCGDSPSL